MAQPHWHQTAPLLENMPTDKMDGLKPEIEKVHTNGGAAKNLRCRAPTSEKSKDVGGLTFAMTADAGSPDEGRAGKDSTNAIKTDMSVISVLVSGDITNPFIVKFWLLLSGGVVVFFAWLGLFSWLAKVWELDLHLGNILTTAIKVADTADGAKNDIAGSAGLFCVDIWFGIALMGGVDAITIVSNFNRSLIHQFHYYVSLRMMLLAFITSLAVHLLCGYDRQTPLQFHHLAAVFALCGALYIFCFIVLEKLHKLLPIRGIGESRGSLQNFSEQMCLFDLTWKRAILFAATNGAVGLALTTLVPARWSMLNPVVHITWEVTFLGLMGTKQTPRYIWFATPIVQASSCTDWGLRQVVAAPRLVIQPWAFMSLMLAGRLILDLHLLTVFRHRRDFQWARKEVLLPTSRLIECFVLALAVEYLGVPVITYIKLISVIILHALGALVFLLPASYALAFDKIKFIRS
ncbi:hypothetical protein QQS21_009602 [Conoideocrella luteorostrata]|uniref:Uncharacterized protein n=1 Tax=Conoideocrella luteorostrata TaxID=1105319 RepID=A0AAJ0CL22_9HYPO|nr:hypothetical protein QQS21_009602 [Conoideocrella luteorostrata]